MRQISQVINQKPRNSKFFDYFIKKYGETATRSAGDDEIYKNLRILYLDICSGSCNSDKYLGYIFSDPRIFQILLQDSYKKVVSHHIIFESLNLAMNTQSPLITIPQFQETYEDCKRRYNTYSVIYNCITNFCNTSNPAYLTQISVTLANKMARDAQGNICL